MTSDPMLDAEREKERYARHCAHELALDLADCCWSLTDALEVLRLDARACRPRRVAARPGRPGAVFVCGTIAVPKARQGRPRRPPAASQGCELAAKVKRPPWAGCGRLTRPLELAALAASLWLSPA
jgi:hypothetical protein